MAMTTSEHEEVAELSTQPGVILVLRPKIFESFELRETLTCTNFARRVSRSLARAEGAAAAGSPSMRAAMCAAGNDHHKSTLCWTTGQGRVGSGFHWYVHTEPAVVLPAGLRNFCGYPGLSSLWSGQSAGCPRLVYLCSCGHIFPVRATIPVASLWPTDSEHAVQTAA